MSPISMSQTGGEFVHVYSKVTLRHFNVGSEEVPWLKMISKGFTEEHIRNTLPEEKIRHFNSLYDLLMNRDRRQKGSLFSFDLVRIHLDNLQGKVGNILGYYYELVNFLFVSSIVLLPVAVVAFGRIDLHYLLKANIFSGIMTFLMVSFVSSIAHELAHLGSATKHGLMAPCIGVKILYFQLSFFADVTAIRGRYEPRVYRDVMSAGVKVNFSICILSMICSMFTGLEIFLYISIINFSFFIVNLIPFFKLDGYYLLSSWINAGDEIEYSYKLKDLQPRSMLMVLFTHMTILARFSAFYYIIDFSIAQIKSHGIYSVSDFDRLALSVIPAVFFAIISTYK